MSWLEDAGHRVTATHVSDKKIRVVCQCGGLDAGCLVRNERLYRNQHWRRVLRTWE